MTTSMSLNTTDHLVALTSDTDQRQATNKGLTDAFLEFRTTNIIVASLALLMLLLTGISCSFSYQRKIRRLQQARLYENTIQCKAKASSVDVRSMRRTLSVCRPAACFTRQQGSQQHRPRVFYIYQNPAIKWSEECILTI